MKIKVFYVVHQTKVQILKEKAVWVNDCVVVYDGHKFNKFS